MRKSVAAPLRSPDFHSAIARLYTASAKPGMKLEDLPKFAAAASEIAEQDVRLRQHVACLPRLRLKLDGLLEFCQSLARIPILAKGDAESGVCGRGVGVEFQRGLKFPLSDGVAFLFEGKRSVAFVFARFILRLLGAHVEARQD